MIVPVIIGPTASGKSSLALALAVKMHGGVINADSMQFYKDIRLLNARPSLDDELSVPHALYGFLPYHAYYNIYLYVQQVLKTMILFMNRGLVPIIVGGTGFYIQALMEGITLIPNIPNYYQDKINYVYHDWPTHDLEHILKLQHGFDHRRLLRRMAIFKFTGQYLEEFTQRLKIPIHFFPIMLDHDNPSLHLRAKQRLYSMLDCGLMNEIEQFVHRYPVFQKIINNTVNSTPHQAFIFPIQRILGLNHFINVYFHNLTIEQACDRTIQDTKHYIKRQKTWFLNKVPNRYTVKEFETDTTIDLILQTIRDYHKK